MYKQPVKITCFRKENFFSFAYVKLILCGNSLTNGDGNSGTGLGLVVLELRWRCRGRGLLVLNDPVPRKVGVVLFLSRHYFFFLLEFESILCLIYNEYLF